MLKKLLLSSAIVSLAVSGAVSAETISVGPILLTQAQSDEYVLDELEALWRADPGSYAVSLAYLQQHRPHLVKTFNRRTLGTVATLQKALAAPAAAGPGGTAGAAAPAGSGLLIGLGVLALAAAAGGGGGGGDGDGDGPVIPGDKDSFETPEYKANYGLGQINASTRYALGGQGQNVKVAVFDSGIDLNNTEFAGRIDLANSKNYYDSATSVQDSDGHGTHVAGIIAGAKNDVGAHGVAFNSTLVILRGVVGDGNALVDNPYADGIDQAIAAGARLMNNSWSYVFGDGSDILITDAESVAELKGFLGEEYNALLRAKQANLLSVFAAGNSGFDEVAVMAGLPALLPELKGYVLGVVAVDSTGTIAEFSNRCGIAMDTCLAAPGVDIPSTKLGGSDTGNVELMSGTSMAAPHMSNLSRKLDAQNRTQLLVNAMKKGFVAPLMV